jgi:hypothetical protein
MLSEQPAALHPAYRLDQPEDVRGESISAPKGPEPAGGRGTGLRMRQGLHIRQVGKACGARFLPKQPRQKQFNPTDDGFIQSQEEDDED